MIVQIVCLIVFLVLFVGLYFWMFNNTLNYKRWLDWQERPYPPDFRKYKFSNYFPYYVAKGGDVSGLPSRCYTMEAAEDIAVGSFVQLTPDGVKTADSVTDYMATTSAKTGEYCEVFDTMRGDKHEKAND